MTGDALHDWVVAVLKADTGIQGEEGQPVLVQAWGDEVPAEEGIFIKLGDDQLDSIDFSDVSIQVRICAIGLDGCRELCTDVQNALHRSLDRASRTFAAAPTNIVLKKIKRTFFVPPERDGPAADMYAATMGFSAVAKLRT